MTNKEAIKLLQQIEEDGWNVMNFHVEALELAIEALEGIPTGEWVEEPIDELLLIYSCSYCGFISGTTWDFCPNCGAKMKGEER